MSDIEASAKALHMKPEYFRKWRIELATKVAAGLLTDPRVEKLNHQGILREVDAIIKEGLK